MALSVPGAENFSPERKKKLLLPGRGGPVCNRRGTPRRQAAHPYLDSKDQIEPYTTKYTS
jgi:hypothetical protein